MAQCEAKSVPVALSLAFRQSGVDRNFALRTVPARTSQHDWASIAGCQLINRVDDSLVLDQALYRSRGAILLLSEAVFCEQSISRQRYRALRQKSRLYVGCEQALPLSVI